VDRPGIQTNVRTAVVEVVSLLASKRYADLERLTRGMRFTAAQIEAAVADSGRTIAVLPSSGDLHTDLVRIQEPNVVSWSVVQPLRTVEEGWSDLSLELTVSVQPDGSVWIELDNIHVE
jgi:hypothetical protein